MRYFLLALIFVAPYLSHSQESKDYQSKVSTLNSTLETLYLVISGEKGENRDWDLFRHLFHKDAKLIPSQKGKNGLVTAKFMSPQEYIKGSGKWLVDNGFYEVELHRDVEQFGNIAHVFSTYESYRSKDDTEPFMRGINSIQMLYDGKRWWIINVYWMQESEEHPIPQKYLPK